MEIRINSDFSQADLNEMRDVYASVGWTKHTNDKIKTVFESSNVIAIVTSNDRIVGFGRAMTDGVFNGSSKEVSTFKRVKGEG
ncbi:hypothetical protein ORD22_13755 [Sporosarcina sp. GW1-11]|uniref:hypothetical protein n=1 Tax=Sporosarcina sp. GW1-11 TaxID=2899126 RepID=UPI00294C16EA|nr:hypothetical protein [Sporosarcina sp. GW1-11]MDV6379280.1 hypothetical protein [Sporosarcina sp. GW1-11]